MLHEWDDEQLQVHAHLGMPGEVRCFEIFAPNPLAVAVTGQLHALARRHPPGTRILIGRKWVARIYECAAQIEGQIG